MSVGSVRVAVLRDAAVWPLLRTKLQFGAAAPTFILRSRAQPGVSKDGPQETVPPCA